MTDETTKPKRHRRRPDDDAKLARAISVLAEDIKRIATMTSVYSNGLIYSAIVERMDDVVTSMHSINAGHAIPEGDKP